MYPCGSQHWVTYILHRSVEPHLSNSDNGTGQRLTESWITLLSNISRTILDISSCNAKGTLRGIWFSYWLATCCVNWVVHSLCFTSFTVIQSRNVMKLHSTVNQLLSFRDYTWVSARLRPTAPFSVHQILKVWSRQCAANKRGCWDLYEQGPRAGCL